MRRTRAAGRRGVALLTTLLLTLFASLLAAQLATQQQLALRRAALVASERQARWYALGAEQWARQVLARDRADGALDHLSEPWAQLPPALALPGGRLDGRLRDLQGRLNVNNLADEALADATLRRLQRLLALLDLDPELAAAIADWIDADSRERFPGGGEDGRYSGRGYLAANRPLSDVSELRFVDGVDADVYARLRPLLTALPVPTALNVNTAPAELLAAWFDGATLADAEAAVAARERVAYDGVGDFRRRSALARDGDSDDNLLLDVASRFFLLQTRAQLGEVPVRLSSVIERADDGSSRVLSRRFGHFE